MRTLPSVCYLVSRYQSHRRSGHDYIECLRDAGVGIVDEPKDADVVIIQDEYRMLPIYFRAFPELASKYTISYSVWEASEIDELQARCLSHVNEIWTCSKYCQEIFSVLNKKIQVVNHIVNPPQKMDLSAKNQVVRAINYNPDYFYYYTIGTLRPRKNLEGAIEAFSGSSDDQNIRFVVKSDVPLPNELLRDSRVINLCQDYSPKFIEALHQLCQCFISAHCSEGWGLGLSEAMSFGNLVIATGYGGNMEFMSNENALIAKYTEDQLSPHERLSMWFTSDQISPRWAYVDMEDLTSKVRGGRLGFEHFSALRYRAAKDMEQFRKKEISVRLLSILFEAVSEITPK